MLRIKVFFGILVFVCGLSVTNHISAQISEKNILLTYVEGKSVSSNKLYKILGYLANTTHVPISLQPIAFTKNSDKRKVENTQSVPDAEIVQIKDGTLEDILNQIVAAYPDFKWALNDGVIEVTPKGSKDAIITKLLEIQIKEVIVEKRINIMSVGSYLCNNDDAQREIKLLGQTGVHFYNTIDSLKEDPRGDQNYFVENDKTIENILNDIVKKSSSKFWTIVRWGGEGEVFTILVL